MAKLASIVGNNTHEAKLANEVASRVDLKRINKERSKAMKAARKAADERRKAIGSVWD